MGGLPLKFSGGDFKEFYLGALLRNDPSLIPNSPGIYAVKNKKFILVYIGQAKGKFVHRPRSLRDRFFKNHFKDRARCSRLRRLVARELSIPSYTDNSGHAAVEKKYEGRITRYIDEELYISFIGADWDRVNALEIAAIKELKPIWNVQHSHNCSPMIG